MKIGRIEGTLQEIRDAFEIHDLQLEDYLERPEAPLSKVWIIALTRPIFCTNPSERVYITAWGCEIGSGRRNGLQAPGAGGL